MKYFVYIYEVYKTFYIYKNYCETNNQDNDNSTLLYVLFFSNIKNCFYQKRIRNKFLF